MKITKKLLSFIATMVLSLSMCMPASACEGTYAARNDSLNITETETTISVMPRYTANLDFSEIPAGYVTHGNNRFNLPAGAIITCKFESTGKFSLAIYNNDTDSYWVSDIIHGDSCSSEITIGEEGNFSIGVCNRDTKAIKVTGWYSL